MLSILAVKITVFFKKMFAWVEQKNALNPITWLFVLLSLGSSLHLFGSLFSQRRPGCTVNMIQRSDEEDFQKNSSLEEGRCLKKLEAPYKAGLCGKESQKEKETERPLALDLNSASVEEILRHCPGTSRKKAEAIVAYRETYGPFVALEELLCIKGIGPKFLEKYGDRFVVNEALSSGN